MVPVTGLTLDIFAVLQWNPNGGFESSTTWWFSKKEFHKCYLNCSFNYDIIFDHVIEKRCWPSVNPPEWVLWVLLNDKYQDSSSRRDLIPEETASCRAGRVLWAILYWEEVFWMGNLITESVLERQFSYFAQNVWWIGSECQCEWWKENDENTLEISSFLQWQGTAILFNKDTNTIMSFNEKWKKFKLQSTCSRNVTLLSVHSDVAAKHTQYIKAK